MEKQFVVLQPKTRPGVRTHFTDELRAIYTDYSKQILGHVVIRGSSVLTPVVGTRQEVQEILRKGFKAKNILVYLCGEKHWADFIVSEPEQLNHITLVRVGPHGMHEIADYVLAEEGDFLYEVVGS